MIKLSDLALEARDVAGYPRVYSRQDKANCNDCDWRIGWNLTTDVVETYFRKHQIESGHSITYSVQQLSEQTFTYVIDAGAGE